MPTRKALRGVAHDFAHAFLSLGAWYSDNSWPIQHLLMAARASGEFEARINLLTGRIRPSSIASRPLGASLALVPESFRDLLERSGSLAELVRSAELTVAFDFSQKVVGKPSGHSFGAGVIEPEMVPYHAVVVIEDHRGVQYQATVKEWWRD